MGKERRTFTIGRDRRCDIPIADDSVSTRHAELTFLDDGKLLITDCKSTNGTWLIQGDGREQRTRQELVSPMDQVRFGNAVLSIKAILEALALKHPRFEQTPAQAQTPQPTSKHWIQGRQLIRCACGAVKSVDEACPSCGR
jgi:predicted component of type VI protein secretion system